MHTRSLHIIPVLLLSTFHVAYAKPVNPQASPINVQLSTSLNSNTTREPTPSWGPPVLHSLVLMSAMRTVEAFLWPRPFAEIDLYRLGRGYQDAFTKPPLFDPHAPAFRWDHDPWHVNVIGHGLFGSELYLRARTCHFGRLGSFLFAAGASATWEYLFEGNRVRPSALDLVYTPVVGFLLGEARFWLWKSARSIANPIWRSTVQIVVDPFGELERVSKMSEC